MTTTGRHGLLELYGCPAAALDDPERVRAALHGGAAAIGAPVLGECVHHFDPHGVTAVLLVAESHLSCHTWPEAGYAAVDVFTCGRVTPEAAVAPIAAALGATSHAFTVVVRGLGSVLPPTGG